MPHPILHCISKCSIYLKFKLGYKMWCVFAAIAHDKACSQSVILKCCHGRHLELLVVDRRAARRMPTDTMKGDGKDLTDDVY